MDAKVVIERIDKAAKDVMQAHDLVGAAVVVVQHGKTIALRGYGLTNLQEKTPVDPERTLFRIGSISKALTLLTLTRLVDQNKLNLSDDVQQSFGPIDNPHKYRKPITIQNLMTHTTGLDQIGTGRHIRHHELALKQRKARRSSIGAFLRANNLRRVSPAGDFYRYDTYGTTLAGAIIEKTIGKPYAEAMRQEMFNTLGMAHTFVEAPDDQFNDLATGYERIAGSNVAEPYEVYLTTPASSIDATAADMGRLLEALTGDGANQAGRLLSAEMTRQVLHPQFRPHPEFPGVTHGLHESFEASGEFARPIRSVDHGGVMAGFRSLMSILPDHGVGVFVVSNTSGVARRNELASRVMRVIVDQLPAIPIREPFAVPPRNVEGNLNEYAGVYSYGVYCHSCTPAEFATGAWPPNRPAVVRVTNGALTIQENEFFSRGSDVFVRADGEQMVFFGRDAVGDIQSFSYSTSDDAFERVDDLPN